MHDQFPACLGVVLHNLCAGGCNLMVDFTLQGRGKREGPVKQECQCVHYGGWGGRLRKRVSCSLVCTWDLYHTIVILQQDNDPSAIRFPKYIWCVDTLCLLSGVCIDRWKGILTPLSAQV